MLFYCSVLNHIVLHHIYDSSVYEHFILQIRHMIGNWDAGHGGELQHCSQIQILSETSPKPQQSAVTNTRATWLLHYLESTQDSCCKKQQSLRYGINTQQPANNSKTYSSILKLFIIPLLWDCPLADLNNLNSTILYFSLLLKLSSWRLG